MYPHREPPFHTDWWSVERLVPILLMLVLTEPRRDGDVGRLAREPAARDAVEHDVERLHHDAEDARRFGLAAEDPWREPVHDRPPCASSRPAAAARRADRSPPPLAMLVPGARLRPIRSAWRLTAMTISAPSARQTETGSGIHQRAIDQPAAVVLDRREDAGQRDRGAHRLDQDRPGASRPRGR